MIFMSKLTILIVKISGEKQEFLDKYNVDTFIDTIGQSFKDTFEVKNRCLNNNLMNQYIYISHPINELFIFKNFNRVYSSILRRYAKRMVLAPLSLLKIERINKNLTNDQNIHHQIFECYCNIFLNSIANKKNYYFENQYFNLRYFHKNITKIEELLLILQSNRYNMIIIENSFSYVDDIMALYKIFSKYDNILEGNMTSLQILFALEKRNMIGRDTYGLKNIEHYTSELRKLAKSDQLITQIFDINILKKETSKFKTSCDVQFSRDIFLLLSDYKLIEKKNNFARKNANVKMNVDRIFALLKQNNSTHANNYICLFQKCNAKQSCYFIRIYDYVKIFYFIFVITDNTFNDSINVYKRCISIYVNSIDEQKLIMRYCYIVKFDTLHDDNVDQSKTIVTELIDGGQNFIDFKKNFLIYLNTPFEKFSDFLPFSIKINSSRYLNWYVDESFYVNHTNLSNTISFECLDELTKMLGDSKNNYNITLLNAGLKRFMHQINCNYSYNIFNILTIKKELTQNLLTLNNFEKFEMLIIAITNKEKIYYNDYLIFPINAYPKIYLISLLNNSWNLFLSKVYLNDENKKKLHLKTLLHKYVCAQIIFTQNPRHLNEFSIKQTIYHIQSEKRICLYVLLFESRNILRNKSDDLLQKCLTGYLSHNDEGFIFKNVTYMSLMRRYMNLKAFSKKLSFYKKLIDFFVEILKIQHSLLTNNKNNMIWYYHGKNSIDVNQKSALIFDEINFFFNTYMKKNE